MDWFVYDYYCAQIFSSFFLFNENDYNNVIKYFELSIFYFHSYTTVLLIENILIIHKEINIMRL